MTSKDEILANFQACSGIDDVGEAFTRLERANWNLTEAYNSIHDLPSVQDVVFPSSPHEVVASDRAADSGGLMMPSMLPAAATEGAGAAAAGTSTDVLHISIQVLMGGMTGHGLFPLEVPRTTTVGELKSTLYQLLGILPCKQVLLGFTQDVTDATVLSPDLLGPENTLSLDTVAPDTAVISSGIQTNHSSDPDVMEIGESSAGTPVAAHTISTDFLSLPGSSASGSSAFSKYEKPPLKPLSNHTHSSGSLFNSHTSPLGSPSASFSSRKSNSHNHKRNKESSSTASSSHMVSDSKPTSRKFVKSDSDSDDASDRHCKSRNSKDKNAITLIIKDTSNNKEYKLSFRRQQTVGNVKQDVSDITEIPVHRQQWTGWPNGVLDESSLARSGVSTFTRLSVKQASPAAVRAAASVAARKKPTSKVGQSDSSSDEFEDAAGLLADEDDDSFLEMMDSSAMDTKPKSLLPADFTGSEQECVAQFATEFGNRYGCSLAPLFFQGSLREAMDQSIMLPAAQRRMLAVYVHHDSSVLANVFCSQMLCQSATVAFVADNFVLWGWDISHSQHKDRLVNIVSAAIGTAAGMTVRGFRIEQLPALTLLTRSRGSCEVISVIYAGNSSLDELVTSMMEATEVFEGTRRAEVAEDQQRLSRQAIMNDQDAAYQESLRADRAKAEARRQQEEDEQREQQRQECIRQHEQQMTEKLRASLESELPPEPADHSSPDVTVMRFRHPGTEQFIRAFTLDTALQVVLNYLHVRGFPADQYKFLQSWPRRDLASLDVSMTLKDYALPHQETITIEER